VTGNPEWADEPPQPRCELYFQQSGSVFRVRWRTLPGRPTRLFWRLLGSRWQDRPVDVDHDAYQAAALRLSSEADPSAAIDALNTLGFDVQQVNGSDT